MVDRNRKKVSAPLTYDPGKGRPKEHLAYLNWQEMQQLQRLNGGNMERGPRGLPSFPPADAIGSSSISRGSSSGYSGSYSTGRGSQGVSRSIGSQRASVSYGGGGADRGVAAARADASRQAAARQASERSRAEARAKAEERAVREKRDRDERARMEAEARNARSAIKTPAIQKDLRNDFETPKIVSGALAKVSAPIPKPKPQPGPDWKIQTAQGIISTANRLGIDPLDLATIVGYETSGSFSPTEPGPVTRWGQHKGYIQFGEPQAKKFGVNWKDPIGSQLGPDGAVEKYLKAAGVKPGMGILDVYSAVNAGEVGRYGASDVKAGGAPGTVRQKVEQQMPAHRAIARSFLSTYSGDYPSVGLSAYGPSPAKARTSSSALNQVSISTSLSPSAVSEKTPERSLSAAESAYRDPFAVAGKRAALSTTPVISAKLEKPDEPSVEPETPPGYFAQFAITPQDMEDLKGRAIKDYGLFSKQLAEMNRNKESLPAFFGPISRDVERVAKQGAVSAVKPVGAVSNKYARPIGPISPKQMSESAIKSISGFAGGISDLLGVSSAEAGALDGAIMGRPYSPYGLTGTERTKKIYDRVAPEGGDVSVAKPPSKADTSELNYGVMVDEFGNVSNMMRSTEFAPENERVELERLREEAIKNAAKEAGFRPSVYENEEFLSDPNRLGMMAEPPSEISPTDMAKVVSRALGIQIPEKYGEEFDGKYLTRSEKDRLAASNIVQRIMKLNPLSRLAILGVEKIMKPEDVETFLARPSYEQEELYRLGREMDERYGRRPAQQIAGQGQVPQFPGRGYEDTGRGSKGREGGGIGGLLYSGVSGDGLAGSFGGTKERPYIYYQWDVGVNIPSPGDPDYTKYQEYLRERESASAA